jgi:hypothetical protein
MRHCESVVGDATGYAELVTRYGDLAKELDACGHLAVAQWLAGSTPSTVHRGVHKSR